MLVYNNVQTARQQFPYIFIALDTENDKCSPLLKVSTIIIDRPACNAVCVAGEDGL
jgi:hypothetical protein